MAYACACSSVYVRMQRGRGSAAQGARQQVLAAEKQAWAPSPTCPPLTPCQCWNKSGQHTTASLLAPAPVACAPVCRQATFWSAGVVTSCRKSAVPLVGGQRKPMDSKKGSTWSTGPCGRRGLRGGFEGCGWYSRPHASPPRQRPAARSPTASWGPCSVGRPSDGNSGQRQRSPAQHDTARRASQTWYTILPEEMTRQSSNRAKVSGAARAGEGGAAGVGPGRRAHVRAATSALGTLRGWLLLRAQRTA